MSDVIQRDGSVISSSQLGFDEHHLDERVFHPMRGIVLSVHPSDDPNNLSATGEADQRGYRNEATVLIIDSGLGEPNLILDNVVIPPESPSGIDDYSERLPRACSRTLRKSEMTEDFTNIDYAELDGDRCMVQFVGGNIDRPYIANWWPHEANKFDPATSSQGSSTLKQSDPQKNKHRNFSRRNGVLTLITKDGDAYLDTTEANSTTNIDPKPIRVEKDPGGNIQVNIKSSKQLEFNWNPPVEGLASGSNSQSQSREPDLPHLNHPEAVDTPPKARDTDGTILRFKEQEGTISTGKMVIYAHKNGGGDGFAMMTAEDGVVIGQGAAGETLAVLSISDGNLTLSTPGGDNVLLQDDEVMVATSGGAAVSLSGDGIKVIAGGGLALGTASPVDYALLGTTFLNILSPILINAEAPVKIMNDKRSATPPQPVTPNDIVTLWNAIAQTVYSFITSHKAGVPPSTGANWLSKTVSTAK